MVKLDKSSKQADKGEEGKVEDMMTNKKVLVYGGVSKSLVATFRHLSLKRKDNRCKAMPQALFRKLTVNGQVIPRRKNFSFVVKVIGQAVEHPTRAPNPRCRKRHRSNTTDEPVPGPSEQTLKCTCTYVTTSIGTKVTFHLAKHEWGDSGHYDIVEDLYIFCINKSTNVREVSPRCLDLWSTNLAEPSLRYNIYFELSQDLLQILTPIQTAIAMARACPDSPPPEDNSITSGGTSDPDDDDDGNNDEPIDDDDDNNDEPDDDDDGNNGEPVVKKGKPDQKAQSSFM